MCFSIFRSLLACRRPSNDISLSSLFECFFKCPLSVLCSQVLALDPLTAAARNDAAQAEAAEAEAEAAEAQVQHMYGAAGDGMGMWCVCVVGGCISEQVNSQC